MTVNEIFLSIQGESLSAGYPTIFVRFTGCNLRCSYCDTTYAYNEGKEMSTQEIYNEICKLHYKRVCLTGGEPLLHGDINVLLRLLDDYSVTIETNGSLDLSKTKLGSKHSFVMDIKTPSSGCSNSMHYDNFDYLTEEDEIKLVIGDANDFDWAKGVLNKYYKKGTITFSSVFGRIRYQDIVEWILRDKLDVRFQIQMHKVIWNSDKRGV
jgi:7-carboxy-7-deazaguanine synthase